MTILTILVIILGALLLWGIVAFNGFIASRNHVREAWADIDVQLKRRYDLIPNIIKTVKGYASHEKDTLMQVVEARSRAMNAESTGNVAATAQAENMLQSTLKTLFALSENYPDLKANANFLELQRELSDTENKIQAARRYYNANVRDYNTKRETVPTNIIASMFGFKEEAFYDLEESPQEREVVQVDFTQ